MIVCLVIIGFIRCKILLVLLNKHFFIGYIMHEYLSNREIAVYKFK